MKIGEKKFSPILLLFGIKKWQKPLQKNNFGILNSFSIKNTFVNLQFNELYFNIKKMLNLKLLALILFKLIFFSCSKSIKTKNSLGSESAQILDIKLPFEVDS